MNMTQRQEPFPLLLFINITTLSFGGIGILASLLFIMLIVSNGTLHTLTNILTLNSSLSILFLSGDMLSIAAFVLYRDLRQRTLHISVPMENMFLCQLRGYAAHIFFCALIYSYVIQAFYRLVGTIFCHRVSFQQKRIYKYAIGLQWLFSVMQTLPVGLGNNQIFIEHEYLCLVALDNRKTVGYLCVTSYLIPYTAITVMYVKIAKAVREKEINGASKYNIHRARRQLVLMRRILILLAILLVLGGPYSTFILMEVFSIARAPSYSHRLGFMFISIAAAISMIAIIYFTRPLRQMIAGFSRKWIGRDLSSTMKSEDDQ